MPRPLTYTPKVHERIVSALRAGASMRDAAGFAGVEWPAFCRWLKAGRLAVDGPRKKGADKRFAQLARDVDQAAHESDVALVGILRRAAEGTKGVPAAEGRAAVPPQPGDWRAAAALLTFRAEAAERRVRLRKLRAEAAVAEKRADGTLPPEKREHTGANGGPIQVNPLHGRLAALAARAAGGADPGAAGDSQPR